MWYVPHSISFSVCPYKPLYGTVITHEKINRTVQCRKWSPTTNDPETANDLLYNTFYPFSRLQVVVLSSEPMQQIVQVNGKKEERLGQKEEKGLLCFLLSGSTLISSPLPSVYILPCSKKKKKRLLAVYKVTWSIDLGVWEGGGALSLWVENHLILCFAWYCTCFGSKF